MKVYQWHVVERFDPKKDYGTNIPPRVRGILSLLKKNETMLSREFVEINKDKIKEFLRVKTDRAVTKAVETSFTVGVQIGVIKKLKGPNDGRIPYEEFCRIPDVSYWISQLNPSNIKNINSKRSKKMGTRSIYGYKLWSFHCWMIGKTFEFSRMIQVGEGKFEQKKQKISLEGVDHFFATIPGTKSKQKRFCKNYQDISS